MKRILLSALLLLGFLAGQCDDSVIRGAWRSISVLDGFTTEKAEGALFGLPESLGEGDLAVHPNASQREAIMTILDAVSDDYLLGQLTDDAFDERLFLEPSDEDGFYILYTLVGSGGADTIAYFDTIDQQGADELVERWEQHVSEVENATEELEQDFSDE